MASSGWPRPAASTPVGVELARESDLLSLAFGAKGVETGGTGEGALDAIRMWVRGVRSDEPRAGLEGLERMARAKAAPEAAAELWAALGVRRLLGGDRVTAWSALARAAEGPTATLVELAATDLGGDMPLPGRVAHARRSRADGSGSTRALARRWPRSCCSMRACRRSGCGAGTPPPAPTRRRSSTTPNRSRRSMGCAGSPSPCEIGAARRWRCLRIAAQLRSDGPAAEHCTQAGRLYEEEGLADEAANAYLEVLRRVPEHEEGYRRLRRILLRREQPAALERLLSFKIAHTTDARAPRSCSTPSGPPCAWASWASGGKPSTITAASWPSTRTG